MTEAARTAMTDRAMTDRSAIADRPVLLYDGVCALCNGVVRFVLRHDREALFRFASLESAAARELLGQQATVEKGVAVVTGTLISSQHVFRGSDAVVETLRLLGYAKLARLLEGVPRPLRQAGYDAVAALRYRVFGRYDVCPVPPPEVRGRFLGD
ncbi:MAG TPA: DCC1-like thiol-disulfide oxidoreductase family protein [Edaphobacter sp.]